MCFSTEASLTSAGVLSSIGLVTSAMNPIKSKRMYAAIPILFGLQQAAEGIVWMSMGRDSPSWSYLQYLSTITFLGFALTVWPSWVPWSIYHFETQPRRRKILGLMGFVGLGVSAITASFLYDSQPTPYITGQCMAYSLRGLSRDVSPNLDFLLYMATVPIPFFVSSQREIRITGALIMMGLFLSHIINQEASTSIWCFFAAMASLHIAWHLLGRRVHAKSEAPI